MSLQVEQIKELVRVSQGDIPADLILLNGHLLDVYTGEILKGFSVAIKGKRIACIGNDISYTIGPDTEVIDIDGMLMIPGLIDAHTHLLMYSPLHEIIKYALKGGTTTIISEAIELAFPYGLDGIKDFLEWTKRQPIKIFCTIPVMHSLSSTGRSKAIGPEALRRLLREENVLGLGETIWTYIINGDQRTYELIAETLASGKLVEGHGAGAKWKSLCAFSASGISSCHESIGLNDVIERLRLGIYAMIREGDIRKELEAIAEIKNTDLDPRRLIIVSDGLAPQTLLNHGYMDHILQKAIDLGFDPIKAIQMMTINPAEHFRLDHIIGGIAPHRYADIVVIPGPREIRPEYVINNGKIAVKQGNILVEPYIPIYNRSAFPSIELIEIGPSEFAISSQRKGRVKVRVIELVSPLVTKEKIWELTVHDNQILPDIKNDIIKVAALTRLDNRVQKFVGLIKGFGLKKGAIATSAVWDACLVVVVGADEKDMAEAVNRVIKMGGGIAVSEGGKITAELSMPIGGIIADMPIRDIARHMDNIQKRAEELGCHLPDAHLAISILTTPYIPFLRVSEKGLFDLKRWKYVPLVED